MNPQELRESVSQRLGCEDAGSVVDLDVAIVGAGVSGLYSAWRLTEGQSERTVRIFEMQNHIGGRLESKQLPGMGVTGELGGMRYMNSQAIVTTLIENTFTAHLEAIPFPMGDPHHSLFYARGQRCTKGAWEGAQIAGNKFRTRYFIPEALQGFSSDQLFNKIIYDVLIADSWFLQNYGPKVQNLKPYEYSFKLTAEDWAEVKINLRYQFDGPYKGMLVNDLGFWNLIKDQAGQEAYEFLSVAGGYFSNTINWNAAEAFPYMVGDFSNVSVEYKTIGGGFDLIAYALADEFLSRSGAAIMPGHSLLSFEKMENGNRRYQLSFLRTKDGVKVTVEADAIILAMPRRSLELLDQRNFFFRPEHNVVFQDFIRSVIPEPAFKLLMGFEKPWWRDLLKADSGVSVTDLPMRQCYYFGTDPANGHSLFLAAYNDMDPVAFWGTLEPAGRATHKKFRARSTAMATQEELDKFQATEAPKVMVDEAMAQIRELHGTNDIPMPYITYFKDWSVDPFGGGYHAWKAGIDVKAVMQFMRRPRHEEAIYICGESYSGQQGWVEGALCVAEKMLEDSFNLTRPSWLDNGYFLGW